MRFEASCEDPEWRSEFVVRAAISAEVVTAARSLRAGDVIDASSLALERREVTAPEDAISDPALVAGKTSRRALRSGQPVSRRWLIEPLLVRRGTNVAIVARNTGVEVQVAGEALAAGRRHEIIQVRNKTNGRVIRARVIDANTVEPVISSSSDVER
ncbi:MAG: flagellar basal body P-ring formation protein FlgA [Xanthomonadaceae bacterium]|nr:flagellar basal body P-ring formation protein FlgA [Xanthomonadaceae bacterium]